MQRWSAFRTTVAVVGMAVAGVAFVAASATDSILSRAVYAQSDPPAAISAIQTPPAVPGIDYTIAGSGGSSPSFSELAPATPVPLASSEIATSTPAIGAADGSMTTSLGGSDIAVSSVGGSHQVDAPGRKSNRTSRANSRD